MMAPVSHTSRYKALGLIQGFVESMESFPSRPALYVDGNYFTYEALARIAGNIAATIRGIDHESPVVGLLAHRSVTAYAAVLGILGAGKGYVPLNPKLPLERLRNILLQSHTQILVVGKECSKILEQLLLRLPQAFAIIYSDLDHAGLPPLAFDSHHVVSTRIMRDNDFTGYSIQDDPLAYLLFTSGSTGEPKGVPVTQRNVKAYLHYIRQRYDVTEYDRFSQMFDLSFDLSVHDMFVCWERGACLYAVPEHAIMAPAKFIRDHQITMWFSVPSVVGVMSRLGLLRPGCFPSLRGSCFCGEALQASYASAWQEAAPNSFVENLYGPTETTIAISQYRWDANNTLGVGGTGIVPIGWLFDGQAACIIDAHGQVVNTGAPGELCLSGSQVTRGYWNSPEKTDRQFVHLAGLGDQVWYRTGDLVKQDERGCLYYLGRIDDQIKIRGHRVELQEIDCVLRKISGTEQVASVAWPVKHGLAEGIVSFISGASERDLEQILHSCREVLPDYMMPRQVHFIDSLPFNIHGKVDRLKLVQMLEEE